MRYDDQFIRPDQITDMSVPLPDAPEETTFKENFVQGVGQMLDHQSSISEYLNSGKYWERNRKLKDLHNSGELDGSIFKAGNDFNWADFADHARENGYEDVMTEREIMQDRRDTLKLRTDIANEVFANSNAMGTAGMFTGYMVGGAADPVLAATAIAGPLALARVFGAGAYGVAATEGISAAVGETIIQYGSVMDWEESIGVEYTNKDALIAITTAGVLSGTVSGVATKLGHMFDDFATRKIDDSMFTIETALYEAKVLEKTNPNAKYLEVQTHLNETEDRMKVASELTEEEAKEILEVAKKTPKFQDRVWVNTKGEEIKPKPKAKGKETPEPEEKIMSNSDEAIDAEVRASSVATEDKKYFKSGELDKRAMLNKRIAMINAARKACKL